MIVAVLEKKAGIDLSSQDIYVNIVGGIRPEGTYTDLAVAMAIYSSCTGKILGSGTLVAGEIGLTGDLRAVHNSEKILREAAHLGFEKVVLPVRNAEKLKKVLASVNEERKRNGQPILQLLSMKNISGIRKLFG